MERVARVTHRLQSDPQAQVDERAVVVLQTKMRSSHAEKRVEGPLEHEQHRLQERCSDDQVSERVADEAARC